MVRRAAAGLLLAAGWGVLARVWMRLISTNPEFSWSGTLFIVGVSAVGGLGLGLVSGAQAAGRRARWRTAALLALPVVTAPQGLMVFLPAFVLGGLALSGRLMLPAQVLLLSVVGAAPVAMLLVVMSEAEREGRRALVFVTGALVLQALMAFGGSQLFRRWPSTRRTTAALADAWQDAGRARSVHARPGAPDSTGSAGVC